LTSRPATADSFADAFLLVERNLGDIKRDAAIVEIRLDLLETQLTASTQSVGLIQRRFQAAGK